MNPASNLCKVGKSSAPQEPRLEPLGSKEERREEEWQRRGLEERREEEGKEKGEEKRKGRGGEKVDYISMSAPTVSPPPHSKLVLSTVLSFSQPFFLRPPLHKVTAATSTLGGWKQFGDIKDKGLPLLPIGKELEEGFFPGCIGHI